MWVSSQRERRPFVGFSLKFLFEIPELLAQNLVRAGLKTIVEMAGGCALQASLRIVQPLTYGRPRKLFLCILKT
jgi:hypothetical protein